MPHRVQALSYAALTANLVASGCAVAWAIPLLLFDTFQHNYAYYEPFESIMSQQSWGLFALTAGGVTIVGRVRAWMTGDVLWTLRIAAGVARVVFFGAVSGVAWVSDPQLPNAWVFSAILITAIFGAAVDISVKAHGADEWVSW